MPFDYKIMRYEYVIFPSGAFALLGLIVIAAVFFRSGENSSAAVNRLV